MSLIDFDFVLSVCILVGPFIYYLLTKNHGYFEGQPIPFLPEKLLLGSTGSVMLKRRSLPEFIKSIYDKFPDKKVFGLLDMTMPMFVLRVPELIKLVAIRDFDHFVDHRPLFGSSEIDHPNLIASKTLFTLTGRSWRRMRTTLSPAFTGVKMKLMFDLVVECSESFVGYHRGRGAQEYDLKDLFSRFASDVIATCAFGIKVDSSRDRDNEFYRNGTNMMNFTGMKTIFKLFGFRLFPNLMGRLGIDLIHQEQSDYFSGLIRNAVATREAEGIVRPDMIHLLMQSRKGLLQHQQDDSDRGGFTAVEESDTAQSSAVTLSDNEMIGQCLFFFLAGFDTVSTALTFLAYELAMNPEIQQKLYEEIQSNQTQLNNGKLTYESLQRMSYLDMVVSESLRLWPPAPAIDRFCVKQYTLDDGEGLTFTIDKGTGIWIPIYAIHRDAKYYPDPDTFDPERFNEQRRANIQPGTYMPFGIGPRNCIGSRFALMEIKCIFYYLLLNFSLHRTNNTTVPPVLAKGFTLLNTEKPMIIQLKPRKIKTAN